MIFCLYSIIPVIAFCIRYIAAIHVIIVTGRNIIIIMYTAMHASRKLAKSPLNISDFIAKYAIKLIRSLVFIVLYWYSIMIMAVTMSSMLISFIIILVL